MRIQLSCALVCLVLAIASLPAAAQTDAVDPRIATLLEQVSESRMMQNLATLQKFDTRNTLSSTDLSARGIGAARQWILDEMTKASPKLQVSFDAYQIPAQGGRITRDVDIRNVMALLPGRSPRRITSARTTTRWRCSAGAAPRPGGAPAGPAGQPRQRRAGRQ